MKYSVLQIVYKTDKVKWLKLSVDSMLSQSIKPSQYVLIINGSIDKDMQDLICEYKVKHKIFTIVNLRKSLNIGYALNEGIKHVKYDYIMRMDSDDISSITRCELILDIFSRNKNFDIVGSNLVEFINNDINSVIGYKVVPERNADIIKFSKYRSPFNNSTVCFKKDSIIKAGLFNNLNVFEDYDLWVRMIELNMTGYNIQKPLVSFRVTDNMYKRRGGYKYLKTALSFKWSLLKKNYINFLTFIIVAKVHILTCLSPVVVRKMIYRVFLRKGI